MSFSELFVNVREAGFPAEDTVIACPLCGRTEQRVLAARGRQSLRRCQKCGVGFLFPLPAETELAEHFGGSSGAKTSDSENNRHRVLVEVAHRIHMNRESGTILDVGCATGFFLSNFFPQSNWRKLAVEVSTCYADQAEARGIHVFRGTMRQARIAKHSVDVLTTLDAFYYFREPQAELAEFQRILKEDGLLVLEMPVAVSRLLRLSGMAGNWLSGITGSVFEESDHLFYFDPKSLSLLLERTGFHVKEIVMLPPNRQDSSIRDLGYRAYAAASRVLRVLTRSRVFLGPRFLIAAEKSRRTSLEIVNCRRQAPD